METKPAQTAAKAPQADVKAKDGAQKPQSQPEKTSAANNVKKAEQDKAPKADKPHNP